MICDRGAYKPGQNYSDRKSIFLWGGCRPPNPLALRGGASPPPHPSKMSAGPQGRAQMSAFGLQDSPKLRKIKKDIFPVKKTALSTPGSHRRLVGVSPRLIQISLIPQLTHICVSPRLTQIYVSSRLTHIYICILMDNWQIYANIQ